MLLPLLLLYFSHAMSGCYLHQNTRWLWLVIPLDLVLSFSNSPPDDMRVAETTSLCMCQGFSLVASYEAMVAIILELLCIQFIIKNNVANGTDNDHIITMRLG